MNSSKRKINTVNLQLFAEKSVNHDGNIVTLYMFYGDIQMDHCTTLQWLPSHSTDSLIPYYLR